MKDSQENSSCYGYNLKLLQSQLFCGFRRHSNTEGLRAPLIAIFQGFRPERRLGQACTICTFVAADGHNNPMRATVVIFAGCFRQSLFEPTYKYCSCHMFKHLDLIYISWKHSYNTFSQVILLKFIGRIFDPWIWKLLEEKSKFIFIVLIEKKGCTG